MKLKKITHDEKLVYAFTKGDVIYVQTPYYKFPMTVTLQEEHFVGPNRHIPQPFLTHMNGIELTLPPTVTVDAKQLSSKIYFDGLVKTSDRSAYIINNELHQFVHYEPYLDGTELYVKVDEVFDK